MKNLNDLSLTIGNDLCDAVRSIEQLARSIERNGDYELVALLLVLVTVTILGMLRWSDPLHHDAGPCPHATTCPYFDPAVDEEDENEDVSPRPSSSTNGAWLFLSKFGAQPPPESKTGPKKNVLRRVWYRRLPVWSRIVGIIAGFILVVPVAIYGSWRVTRLAVERRLCRCRHRKGCHLNESNYRPAEGSVGGSFRIVGGRAGYDADDGSGWKPGARKRSQAAAH